MSTRRDFMHQLAGTAGLSALGLPLAAHAQATPEQARILVGFPAGGTTDTLARRVAEKLRGPYAVNVGVENKPGAGGQLAITALKESAADGSTLLLTPSSMLTVYPFTYPRLPYTQEELAPVSLGCFFSYGFGVGPSVPASVKNLKDYLAWAKANPTLAQYGSPAAGATPHLLGAVVSKMSGVELRHMAYRGSAPGMQDLLAGQLSAMSSPVGDFLPHLKSGKVRLLAVSGARQNPYAPGIQTYREQGYPLTVREWYGFFLPAKASPGVIRRAAAYLQTALAQQDLVNAMSQVGMEVQSTSPQELAALLKTDTGEWRRLIKMIGFTAET